MNRAIRSGTVRIRPLRSADLKEVTRLARLDDSGTSWIPAKPGKFRARHRVFVSRFHGKVVGYVATTWIKYGAKEAVGSVDELLVDKPFRSRGIGRQLVDRAMQWLRAQGPLEVAFVTTDVSHASFYEQIGFKRCKGPWLWRT